MPSSADNETKFVISLTTGAPRKNYMVLPMLFVTKFKDEIPIKCFINVSNGDTFEVLFVGDMDALVGVRCIFSRYQVPCFSFLVFQYLGGADFSMRVFTPYAVEFRYPEPPITVNYSHEVFPPTVVRTVISLSNKFYFEAMKYNYFGSGACSWEIYIHSNDQLGSDLMVSETYETITNAWTNGSCIRIRVAENFWDMKVCKSASSCCLANGWADIVSSSMIEVGDLCLFYADFHSTCYRLVVFKMYNQLANFNRTDRMLGRRFMKIADEDCIKFGTVFLPKLFWEEWDSVMSDEVTVYSSGRSIMVQYNREKHLLFRMGRIIRKLRINIGDFLVFNYQESGLLYLYAVKEGAPEIFM